ncbi:unnamed protein product [Caenorhabditis auriculariae]|uniref:Potassium channel domain-containing protein n=1 Tax=Caenorhabditis auriculariae TaxID=2777116 RepID=A0A8S1HSA4_9PELO|nr:unnamed protein product [Caenorhabditis auriculariae]
MDTYVSCRLEKNRHYEVEICRVMDVKQKCRDLAPYALHLAMVGAVAVYVVAGAFAIRQIEGTLRQDLQTQLQEPTSDVASRRKRYEEPQTLPRDATRRCVAEALQKIAATGNCTKIFQELHVLDACYYDRLSHGAASATPDAEVSVVNLKTSNSSKGEDQDVYVFWTVMDSVLFCFTVITTIGYGNVAPRTFYGRLFVILYGLVGVPFTMLAIANLGKFLATLLKSWARPFVRCFRKLKNKCCGSKEDTNNNEAKEKQHLMEKSRKKAKKIEEDNSMSEDDEEPEENEEYDTFILFLAFVIYIVVGSLVIAAYEPEMDFFEVGPIFEKFVIVQDVAKLRTSCLISRVPLEQLSNRENRSHSKKSAKDITHRAIYFNFVTLTTIGLGDLVPQSQTYLVITLIYCAVGLALTTIAIEIAADTLKKLHYFGRKLDNVANVQVWFGGKKISMKALVKNLGDQFNVPIEELENLDLGKFVDDAIAVEEGALATLRNERAWMNSNYWRAIESGSMHYVDDDDLVTLRSNLSESESRQFLLSVAPSRPSSVQLVTVCHAPCVPSPLLETPQTTSSSEVVNEYIVRAVVQMQPAFGESEMRKMSVSPDLEQLLQAHRKNQQEARKNEGRWSEEALRRYEEYRKTWKKFRHTQRKK